MTDTIGDFFADLERHGRDLIPDKYSGTVRFDLSSNHIAEHWVLVIEEGSVSVVREDWDADCVIRTRRDVFTRILAGEQGVYPAFFRNLVSVEGDLALLTAVRELLPLSTHSAPAASRDREV
ncbi:SCP2 sterol-binding domain-containing protein [Plantactinospora sp. GCM10030261]|uniref:SCP2 sterol-binding domain-containing protein n=1 Tax=Plantactinospora sp. GCM10030261 TaxID=3273420 RepID=UPI003622ACDF